MPEPRNPPSPAAPAPDPPAPESAAALPPPRTARLAEAADSVTVTVHGPAGASPAGRERIARILVDAVKHTLDPRTE